MTNEEKIVYLGRDPFAREDFIKKYIGIGKCDFCGRNAKLWRYGTENDNSRRGWAKGSFCSKGCYNAYHT
jgi:hypothetical protein